LSVAAAAAAVVVVVVVVAVVVVVVVDDVEPIWAVVVSKSLHPELINPISCYTLFPWDPF